MKKLLLTLWIIWAIILWNSFAIAGNGFQLSNEYVSWIDVPRTDETDNSNPQALYIAVKVINRVLSLTSVVAIVMFLIWGFKVILSNGDETKAKGWYKILKNATIWIVIIWLTRAIIRLIFRFVDRATWSGDFTT